MLATDEWQGVAERPEGTDGQPEARNTDAHAEDHVPGYTDAHAEDHVPGYTDAHAKEDTEG